MVKQIKSQQLPRLGYEYQDLICIKFLIDWFHKPHIYRGICIESSCDINNISSLDDVIILDSNNCYQLIQVKFTIDSARKDLKLSFNWLLARKKNGTSLIQKWAKDLFKYYDNQQLSAAMLQTNRTPDHEFATCLKNKKIDITLIPTAHMKAISLQLGGENKAEMFFQNFIFEHSQEEMDDLEITLREELVPSHTKEPGWHQLLATVKKWATTKDSPRKDGWIILDDVYKILQTPILKPLDELFEIPDAYVPPSPEFHNTILKKIKNTGCFVISGAPGIGKSTYLSYLVQYLKFCQEPVIHHHYYLPNYNNIGDRISYVNVSETLQLQLSNLLPDVYNERSPEHLEDTIRKAANEFRKLGKILVIVIDGLDHATRERKDISQLEHLFNRIIAFKNEVCLLIGTQPIHNDKLPNMLIAKAPKDEHFNLPPMDLNAIKCYLRHCVANKKLNIYGNENDQNKLAEAAEALLGISNGYPLHIIYSINHLISRGEELDTYFVEKLPACIDDNINTYYELLWSDLSPNSKEILFLIACAYSSWPEKNSLRVCLGQTSEFNNAFASIEYLIDIKRSGVFLFHESILIFIRDKKEFKNEKINLIKKIQAWLKYAPDYWRWSWSGIVEAELGNTEHLLHSITREWLIDSLCKGYPLQHIEHIIRIAEQSSLEHHRIDELVRIRLIRYRLKNGPEFQTQNFDDFLLLAIKNSSNKYGQQWLADNLRNLSDQEIALTASLHKVENQDVNKLCFNEIMKRFQFFSGIEGNYNHEKIEGLIRAAIKILTDSVVINIDDILYVLSRLTNNKKLYFKVILDGLTFSGNRHVITQFDVNKLPDEVTDLFFTHFALACSIENISLSSRLESEKISNNAISVIKLFLEKYPTTTKNLIEDTIPEAYENTTEYFYNRFFCQLAKQIEMRTSIYCPKHISSFDRSSFVAHATSVLEYCAFLIAEAYHATGYVSIFDLYQHIDISKLERHNNHYDYGMKKINAEFLNALIDISLDCHILFPRNHLVINSEQFVKIQHNVWWDSISWLEGVAKKSLALIQKEYAQDQIIASLESLKLKKDNTLNLANESIRLAKLADKLSCQEESQKCLQLSAKHVLGYGWRKDITISDIYAAIGACAEQGINVKDWLHKISPFTHEIELFTEREISHVPGWFIKLLAKYYPERLAEEFEYQLTVQNWAVVDNILENFVREFNLETFVEKSLLRCISSPAALDQLRARAEATPELTAIYNEQLTFLGGMPPLPISHRDSDFSRIIEIDFNFGDYPINKLNELQEDLKKKDIHEADYIEKWIDYWSDQGFGRKVLQEFDEICRENDRIPSLIRECLDHLFTVSQKLEGDTIAYAWAIKSIIVNNHWGLCGLSNKAESALKKYARIYSHKWQALLSDTIAANNTMSANDWLCVAPSMLVKFLISAGETQIASSVTEVMVKNIEEEISHLSIKKVHWSTGIPSLDRVPSKILLLYYKYPDRFIRLRTAHQISKALDSCVFFRSIFLEHIGKLFYEVDIIDYLSILLLCTKNIFTSRELYKTIKYPSILSEIILNQIENTDKTVEIKPEYYSGLTKDDYVQSKNFEKLKNGFMPYFLDNINRLSKLVNYPLDKHMSAEADQIITRSDFNFFNVYDFCGDIFYRDDKINCSLSTPSEIVMLSAYLRTIAFACSKFNIPLKDLSEEILMVAPFERKHSRLLPSPMPSSWCKLESTGNLETISNTETFSTFIDDLFKEDNIPLRANGPLFRKLSGICCDVELIVFKSESEVNDNPRDIYSKLAESNIACEALHALAEDNIPDSIGRWQIDLAFSRGIFEPKQNLVIPDIYRKINLEKIDFITLSNSVISTWKYWTLNWYPVHYREIGPNLGTYTFTTKDILRQFIINNPGIYLYVISKFVILDKTRYGGSNRYEEKFTLKPLIL